MFEYGCDNRFFDQYFKEGSTAVGTFGPLKAGGHTNGALAIVVAAKTAVVASKLTISVTACDTEGGSYTAPTNANVVTCGGTSFEAGDIIGRLIVENDVAEYVKAVIGGTLTSGIIDVYLQYLPR
jgi:glycine/D-amino acid oxidase-like deaminating enzyme